jgi:alkanesulfonate monooxygenase SsuD/methylene tetrahydromethanopterin reductase-like flavin-dependent oxidoreductase (luciferase family)
MSSDTTERDPIKFAYWVSNVSGGLVVSKIPQRTDWSLEYNVKLAQLAEEAGFDYALSQIRFTAGYGAEYQHESVMNAFIIARETEAEAKQVLQDIIKHADVEAVHAFGDAVKQAGKASPEGEGNWATSTFEDLVQYNDGFRAGLIGTPEQIAQRIVDYQAAGVDLILGGFLHFQEEVEYFGKRILPLVRELEARHAERAA